MSDSKQEIKQDTKQNTEEKQDMIENNNESIEQKEKKEEEKEEEEEEVEQSKWTPVWDDNAQAYYWWNTETNETTWINPDAPAESYTEGKSTAASTATTSNNPLDFLLDRIDNVVKKKLDGQDQVDTPEQQDPYYSSTSYDQYYDPNSTTPTESYTSHAHFNARTGRFTTQADVNRLNPEMLSIESRATRQMQNYFDVDTYTEQRNAQIHMADSGRINKKKPLTRKEVEYFKKMKKEKKSKRAREWLMQ